MESVLFADMDFPEENSSEIVGGSNIGLAVKMKEARERMRKIMSGELPVDSIEIPMEKIKHIKGDLPEDSLRTVVRQLGFVPLNLVNLYPLNVREPTLFQVIDQEIIPFPTMFWVSCPVLHSNISKLEMDGWIQKLTDRLLNSADSDTYLASMKKAHNHYAEERWNSLTVEDRQRVESCGWVETLHDTGVAGMKNYASIKCMHTHFAHHASRPHHGNIVGQWVQELLVEHNLL